MLHQGVQGALNGVGTIYPINGHAIAQPAPATVFERIPAELRARRQWCLAGTDKAPMFFGQDGQIHRASVNDPATFGDFDAVASVALARGVGIGYVLVADDPFTIVDIDIKDDTSEAEIGRLVAVAHGLNSYTERSRGGKGLHVVVRGKVGKGRRRDGVEVYSQQRFIIFTGHQLAGYPETIEDRQSQLASLMAQMPSHADAEPHRDAPQLASDEAVIAEAASAKFDDLFAGRWQRHNYPSQSEADAALMAMIASRTANDAQTKRIFRSSGLGQRDKASRADYLDRTLLPIRARQAREAALTPIDTSALAKQFATLSATPPPASDILMAADLFALPPLIWLIKGVIPEKSLNAIYGPSGAGKSFLAFAMACALAEGSEFLGLKTKPRNVLYVWLEGEAGMQARAKALQKSNGRPLPDALRYRIKPFQLTNPSEVTVLAASLPPTCVVFIDTLNRAAPMADENSSKDMGAIIEGAKLLQRLIGGTVVLIAHPGKDRDKGIRGHSSLFAALDSAIEVKRDSNGVRSWSVAKSKDGSDGAERRFRLQVVDLGVDADGEKLTSCVVLPDETGVVEVSKVKPLAGHNATAMQTFRETATLNANGTLAVQAERWRAAFYRKCTADGDAKRKAFGRACDALIDRNVLTHIDGIFFEVRQPELSQLIASGAAQLADRRTGHGHSTDMFGVANPAVQDRQDIPL